MKKFAILIFFAVSLSSLSQSMIDKNTDLRVLYQLDYKKFINSDVVKSENAVLIAKNQGSLLFTFEKMMSLDSIQKSRALTASDVLLYRPAYFFLIKRNSDSISHYGTIGNDLLKFEESVNLNWKLTNEEKLIRGYTCKKSTLNYAGRDWIAWYTTEIPIDAGPYKFHGLPGLIINIRDTEENFEFTVNEIKTGDFDINPKVNNYFITEEGETFQEIEKNKFHEIRNKFYTMTLNERLQYMNRENEGTHSYVITGTNGETPRTNRKTKTRNFIERYQEK